MFQTLCEALAVSTPAECEVFLVWSKTSQLPVVSTGRIYDLWLVVGKDLGQLLEAFIYCKQPSYWFAGSYKGSAVDWSHPSFREHLPSS